MNDFRCCSLSAYCLYANHEPPSKKLQNIQSSMDIRLAIKWRKNLLQFFYLSSWPNLRKSCQICPSLPRF